MVVLCLRRVNLDVFQQQQHSSFIFGAVDLLDSSTLPCQDTPQSNFGYAAPFSHQPQRISSSALAAKYVP